MNYGRSLDKAMGLEEKPYNYHYESIPTVGLEATVEVEYPIAHADNPNSGCRSASRQVYPTTVRSRVHGGQISQATTTRRKNSGCKSASKQEDTTCKQTVLIEWLNNPWRWHKYFYYADRIDFRLKILLFVIKYSHPNSWLTFLDSEKVTMASSGTVII